jgi:phosphate transport system permease protein
MSFAPPKTETRRRGTARSVILLDRAAGFGITSGGIVIVLAVIGILVFVLHEVAPLFRSARSEQVARFRLSEAAPLLIDTDEYREIAYAIGPAPVVRFFDPVQGTILGESPLDSLTGARIVAAARAPSGPAIAIAAEDGRIQIVRIDFTAAFGQDGLRHSTGIVEPGTVLRLLEGAPRLLGLAGEGEDLVLAAGGEGRKLRVWRRMIKESLLEGETRIEEIHDLSEHLTSQATALAWTRDGRRLFVGLADGGVQCWVIEEEGPPALRENFQAMASRGITAVTSVCVALGDQTVIVGGGDGSVQGWFEARDPAAGRAGKLYQPVHPFEPHPAAVTHIAPSSRDRCFVTADATGGVRLQHLTTERTLLRFPSAVAAAAITYAPKGDGLVTALADGTVQHWSIEAPHPEISWNVLFGKVWYEGYDKPEFVWQSTGGSDEFEPKVSLIPLVFGTIKGTFYALAFAVPIALLSAIYASQFLNYRIRNILKPTIEIMAALPSVVLGLVAGLFLAPYLESVTVGTLLTLPLLPLLILIAALAWRALPLRWTGRFPAGAEVLLLLPVVLAGIWLGQAVGPAVERALFGGDFHIWLHDTANLRYDQRNCIVVGFAMGFAVIPIIFTICEDSLSAVPQHLITGSIACGASRWQTALRIVLPAAGSGIFSAIMVGFGRAVGETMIVLMATGNTPILDWSIFDGMRTLSANIAVEIPEAPYRSTLYRILFLSGFLLFLCTFAVNGVAEAIRIRLRRKFGNY